MITIYGLRECGSNELRYIGQSSKPLAERLRKHLLNARRGYPPLVSGWINAAGSVEIAAIATCPSSEADAEERRLVELYHALGHRLTNSHLLPRARMSAAAA